MDLDLYLHHQPNLLIYGDSGKHRIVREFLSKKYQPKAHYKHAVHWLYCIHTPTQEVLAQEVKRIGKSVYRPWTSTSPTHRVIVLDGIEFIPYTVQASLRRCIELFSSHTRFILIGHSYNQLMKPIQSRFVIIPCNCEKEMSVKEIMKQYGKRNSSKDIHKMSMYAYHSLFQQSYQINKPYKSEYHTIKNQIQWMNKFFTKSKVENVYADAQDWVNQGWSMRDLLCLLVFETTHILYLYDVNGIRKLLLKTFKEFPQQARYTLWNKVFNIMKGQQSEVFWVSWILAEIHLYYQRLAITQ